MSIAKQEKQRRQKRSRTSWRQWYSPENLELVEGWTRDGLSDAQIAENIGINVSTIYDWKRQHPEFLNAFKKGKQVANVELENALFKKAIGAKTTTTTYRVSKVDDTVLKARRLRFADKYMEEHPEATKKEALLAATEHVDTHEKIIWSIVETQQPPDTGALMFLMKNRMPEKYREQSYQELNHAQVIKAKAEAKKAEAQAKVAEEQAASITRVADNALDKISQLSIDDLERLARMGDDDDD